MGNTEVIVPYDLSMELRLIGVKCSDTRNHATQKFDVRSVEIDEDDLPGVKLTEEPPNYNHLSKIMQTLAKSIQQFSRTPSMEQNHSRTKYQKK